MPRKKIINWKNDEAAKIQALEARNKQLEWQVKELRETLDYYGLLPTTS